MTAHPDAANVVRDGMARAIGRHKRATQTHNSAARGDMESVRRQLGKDVHVDERELLPKLSGPLGYPAGSCARVPVRTRTLSSGEGRRLVAAGAALTRGPCRDGTSSYGARPPGGQQTVETPEPIADALASGHDDWCLRRD